MGERSAHRCVIMRYYDLTHLIFLWSIFKLRTFMKLLQIHFTNKENALNPLSHNVAKWSNIL